jgi:hypothetical protein
MVIVLIIIVLVALYFVFFHKEKHSGSLKLDNQIVLFMGEPLDIPIEVNASEEIMDDISTAYFSESEDIVELSNESSEEFFFGTKGVIKVNPLSVGEDDISIVSTYGTDKYSEVLDTKNIHAIVYPKFDKNLLSKQIINLTQATIGRIDLNLTNNSCLKNIRYTSLNSSIASVDANGLVSGIKKGKALVKVSNGSNSFDVVVNVY